MEDDFIYLVDLMRRPNIPFGELALAHGDVAVAELEYDLKINGRNWKDMVMLNELYFDELMKSVVAIGNALKDILRDNMENLSELLERCKECERKEFMNC